MPRPSTSQDASSEGIDNFQLPKALVIRIAKSVLPHDTKLQKDTVGALVDGSTVFINYLAATTYQFVIVSKTNVVQTRSAQDVAASRSHKTISGPDVLKALEIIEFNDLVPILQGELDEYRGTGKQAKGKGRAVDVKERGKGKEKEPMGNDATFEPDLTPSAAATAAGEPEPEDEPEMLENAIEEPDEDAFDEDDEMAEAEEEDVDDEDGDEPEEVVDTVTVEEEELKQDRRGLEESDPSKGPGEV